MPARRGEQRSAYARLADELRSAIRDGEYAGGRRLPTEATLAESHGLSRQTVRRAYLELVGEGLVDRVPGRGTFVAERDSKYVRHFGSVEDLMGFSIDTSVVVLEPLRPRVNMESAARLGLKTDVVHSVTYLRSHLETPFALTTVCLPSAVARRVRDVPELTRTGTPSPLTVISVLETHLGVRITAAEQTITAERAVQEVAARLRCSTGDPLLRIDRLFVSSEGVPVEWSSGCFLPEQYTYRVTLTRSGR